MNQERLKFIHNTIVHWIDKTDTKAQIFLGIQLAILGYLLANLKYSNFLKNYNITFLLFLISLLFIFLSIFYLLRVLWPRLSTSEHISYIYFKHIEERYRHDKKKAIHDYNELKDDEFDNDLISQIISLSIVGTSKYKDLQKIVIILSVEIILVILMLILG